MGSAPAPALETGVEKKPETPETCEAQPVTLRQRFQHLLCKIFEGHEEYLGSHQ